MSESEFKKRVREILEIESVENYDSSESASESIADEFEELTIEQHAELCEMVEIWFDANR